MTNLLGLPVDASAQGAEIDNLIVLVHVLMALLFIGWAIYFVIALVRFRQGRNPVASYHGSKSHFSTYIEGGVAIFEAILLIAFAVPVWARRVSHLPPEKDSTVVRVVAQQFAWNIHYPGPDGVFGRTDIKLVDSTNPVGLDRSDPAGKDDVVTINQLHLPVNRPVIIHLTSRDVIHSFFLPVMRVKQDAIPGMNIPVWFEPIETGKWEIACAQLCGLSHYRMRGFLTVETPAEYAAWLASEAPKG
jgi:cytochrome c oxidase subunit II